MYELSKKELLLMRVALQTREGVFIGQITSQLGISVIEAAISFRVLRKRGFLVQKESLLVITKRGREWMLNNQSMFAYKGDKPWRDVPERFRAQKIAPYQPYAPTISILSTKKFKVGKRQDG